MVRCSYGETQSIVCGRVKARGVGIFGKTQQEKGIKMTTVSENEFYRLTELEEALGYDYEGIINIIMKSEEPHDCMRDVRDYIYRYNIRNPDEIHQKIKAIDNLIRSIGATPDEIYKFIYDLYSLKLKTEKEPKIQNPIDLEVQEEYDKLSEEEQYWVRKLRKLRKDLGVNYRNAVIYNEIIDSIEDSKHFIMRFHLDFDYLAEKMERPIQLNTLDANPTEETLKKLEIFRKFRDSCIYDKREAFIFIDEMLKYNEILQRLDRVRAEAEKREAEKEQVRLHGEIVSFEVNGQKYTMREDALYDLYTKIKEIISSKDSPFWK